MSNELTTIKDFINYYKYDRNTVTYGINIKEETKRITKNVLLFIDESSYFNPKWEMIEAASAIMLDRKSNFSNILNEVKERKTNLSKKFLWHFKIFSFDEIMEIRNRKELSKELLKVIHMRALETLILRKDQTIGAFRKENKGGKKLKYEDINDCLDILFKYINSNVDDDFIMIKVAIICQKLMLIMPFENNNYYVISVFIKLFLDYKGYYGYFFLFNISNILLKHEDLFKKTLYDTRVCNLSQWLRFYLERVCDFSKLFNKQVKLIVDYKNKCILNYGSEMANLLFEKVIVTAKDLGKILNCSNRNSQRIFNNLTQGGVLVGDKKERYREACEEKILSYYYICQEEMDDALNANTSIKNQIKPKRKKCKMHLEKRDTYRLLVYKD